VRDSLFALSSVARVTRTGTRTSRSCRVLRFFPPEVQAGLVEKGIAWLDANWHGDVFVPDELLSLVVAV